MGYMGKWAKEKIAEYIQFHWHLFARKNTFQLLKRELDSFSIKKITTKMQTT